GARGHARPTRREVEATGLDRRLALGADDHLRRHRSTSQQTPVLRAGSYRLPPSSSADQSPGRRFPGPPTVPPPGRAASVAGPVEPAAAAALRRTCSNVWEALRTARTT